MFQIPKEIDVFGVYLSPTLIVAIGGVILAIATAYLLNRFRLSRIFYFPPLVFLSLAIFYACLIGTFLIPI